MRKLVEWLKRALVGDEAYGPYSMSVRPEAIENDEKIKLVSKKIQDLWKEVANGYP